MIPFKQYLDSIAKTNTPSFKFRNPTRRPTAPSPRSEAAYYENEPPSKIPFGGRPSDNQSYPRDDHRYWQTKMDAFLADLRKDDIRVGFLKPPASTPAPAPAPAPQVMSDKQLTSLEKTIANPNTKAHVKAAADKQKAIAMLKADIAQQPWPDVQALLNRKMPPGMGVQVDPKSTVLLNRKMPPGMGVQVNPKSTEL